VLKAYKDGVLITSNSSPSGNPTSETGTLKLGRHALSAQYFGGSVDDVRIYNRALNQHEIEILHAGTDQKIYWLSIAPRWGSDDHYDWGWKTRPWHFEDDAVVIQQATPWPPIVGTTKWISGIPIQYPPYPDPEGVSWDVAFELTTNEPAYEDNPIPGDVNADGEVNFKDVAITAASWLERAPGF